MSAREWAARRRWVAGAAGWGVPALVGAAVLAFTSLPTLVGQRSATGDRQFMGIVFNVPDTAQYFAWMRAAARAPGLLIANPLTPEPNAPAFFNLLWFALGHLAAALDLPAVVVYGVFRWVAGGILLAVLWAATGVWCRAGRERLLAFLLVVLGGGWGWVWVALKHATGRPVPPLDVYVAEPNTFFSLLAFPHLVLAVALLTGIFLLCARGNESGRWSPFTGAATLAGVLGLTHAYDLLIVYVVLGVFTLLVALRRRAIPWRLAGGVALVVAVSSPPALYFTVLTSLDPTWRGVLAQYGNAGVVTPTPGHLLILLGPVFLVALGGLCAPAHLRQLWRGPERDLLPFAWFFASFPLAYIPTSYQIKMLTGWQVSAGLIAARVLLRVALPWLTRTRIGRARWFSQRATVLVGAGLIALSLPTNLYLVAWRGDELSRGAAPYSLSAGDVAALHWFAAHADSGDVVLSSQAFGQYVAGESDARPVIAHWAQTLGYYEKEEAVRRFYDMQTQDATRDAILERWEVRYVVFGPEERRIGPFVPATSPRFEQVFTSAHTTIYAVSRVSPGAGRRGDDAAIA